MSDDFRLLTSADELAGDRITITNHTIIWVVVLISITGIAVAAIVAYFLGQNSIMPALETANTENEQLKQKISKNAVQTIVASNSPLQHQQVPG